MKYTNHLYRICRSSIRYTKKNNRDVLRRKFCPIVFEEESRASLCLSLEMPPILWRFVVVTECIRPLKRMGSFMGVLLNYHNFFTAISYDCPNYFRYNRMFHLLIIFSKCRNEFCVHFFSLVWWTFTRVPGKVVFFSELWCSLNRNCKLCISSCKYEYVRTYQMSFKVSFESLNNGSSFSCKLRVDTWPNVRTCIVNVHEDAATENKRKHDSSRVWI